jgi:hypothetical protein
MIVSSFFRATQFACVGRILANWCIIYSVNAPWGNQNPSQSFGRIFRLFQSYLSRVPQRISATSTQLRVREEDIGRKTSLFRGARRAQQDYCGVNRRIATEFWSAVRKIECVDEGDTGADAKSMAHDDRPAKKGYASLVAIRSLAGGNPRGARD